MWSIVGSDYYICPRARVSYVDIDIGIESDTTPINEISTVLDMISIFDTRKISFGVSMKNTGMPGDMSISESSPIRHRSTKNLPYENYIRFRYWMPWRISFGVGMKNNGYARRWRTEHVRYNTLLLSLELYMYAPSFFFTL